MTDHIEYRLCVMPSASTPQHESFWDLTQGDMAEK